MAEKPVKEVVEELLERVSKLENEMGGGASIDGTTKMCVFDYSSTGLSKDEQIEKDYTFEDGFFNRAPEIFISKYISKAVSSSSHIDRLLDVDVEITNLNDAGFTLYVKNNGNYTSGYFSISIVAIDYFTSIKIS